MSFLEAAGTEGFGGEAGGAAGGGEDLTRTDAIPAASGEPRWRDHPARPRQRVLRDREAGTGQRAGGRQRCTQGPALGRAGGGHGQQQKRLLWPLSMPLPDGR